MPFLLPCIRKKLPGAGFLYHLNPMLFGTVFMAAGNLLSLVFAFSCYWFVSKYMKQKEDIRSQYIRIIFIPLLLIFTVSGYINFIFYGNTLSIDGSSGLLGKNHIHMLLIQVLGIISIFCILYVYQKLTESYLLSTELSVSIQQNHFQKQYVDEAWAHYISTKSLRHDMDLCIILSNALDNAICACEKQIAGEKKYIRIASYKQEDFYMNIQRMQCNMGYPAAQEVREAERKNTGTEALNGADKKQQSVLRCDEYISWNEQNGIPTGLYKLVYEEDGSPKI